jgi:hypothetical protein
LLAALRSAKIRTTDIKKSLFTELTLIGDVNHCMNQPIPTHDLAHWQGRADEARLKASQATDPEVKTVLLEIALAYERLAQIVAKPQH